jgi:small conductance mechanosensitive channel
MSEDDVLKLVAVAVTVLAVLAALWLTERLFRRRTRLADAVSDRLGDTVHDPVLQTRIRFVRRLVEAAIIVIGIATVLGQFTALDRFAASVLASGAIAAAVIGFAAQRALGNVIAGVLLAVTQPIRIGDQISFEGHSGVVEDIRLAHTVLQTGVDARVIVPNGKLADTVVRNDSIGTPTVGVEAELWLSHDSDELRALEVLREALPDATPAVTTVTSEGTTITVTGPPTTPVERAGKATELLQNALQALRNAGLR